MIQVINEKKINKIIVTNNKGLYISFLDLGASIDQIMVPDRDGNIESVVMHPLNLEEYKSSTSYYGKTIGRVSGRIDEGKYFINEKEYQLDLNDKNHNCLHGGYNGCSEKYWAYEIIRNKDEEMVVFSLSAKDDDRFNGNLDIQVKYTVKLNENTIKIEYFARTNEDSLCNLTNHTYFNLSGNGKKNILGHYLKILADRYTKLNEYLIPVSVEKVNKIMDFNIEKKIGEDIYAPMLKEHNAFGYDHAFLFEEKRELFNPAVELVDKESGRSLSIYTSYPCVVVYTCNYPKGEVVQKNHNIELHDAVCLECQFIPNAIKMDDFKDDIILKKDDVYYQNIIYKFEIK